MGSFTSQSDHDLLLKIATHVEYIRADIKKVNRENQIIKKLTFNNKDKIEQIEGKMKIWVGVAATIGGIIIWLVDRVINYISQKI